MSLVKITTDFCGHGTSCSVCIFPPVPRHCWLTSLLLVVALLLVAGCTNSSPPPVPPTPVYTPQTTILIGSVSFNPQILVVDRGITVTWLNLDMGRHFVTSDPGDPDSFISPLLETDQRYQFTFTVPGKVRLSLRG